MQVEVVIFLSHLPIRLSVRTYQAKKTTGRHCTLASLQKYTRELFTATFNTPYSDLPKVYQVEIEATIMDAYHGMKEARTYE